MNILMFGWEFPPYNSGGLGVACFGLAKALAEKEAELKFVLPQSMDVSVDFMRFIFANIKNAKLTSIDSLLSAYISSPEYLDRLSRVAKHKMYGDSLLAEVERYATEAARIASSENFDIIHAHDWLSFGAGVEAKLVSGKPLVVHVHATEFDRTGGSGVDPRVYAIEKESMIAADRVITVSEYTRQMVLKHYGIDASKVKVVHNGVDPAAYQLTAAQASGIKKFKKLGYKIVLYVGRITLQKGVDYLLHSACEVIARNPKTLFVIAGSGDMERQIIKLAIELGISDHVLFAGFVRGYNLSQLYNSADVLVMPSVSEPFGLIALESLLHKTPIIISKQSGVAEVTNNALKIDFWDTQELANKILAVISYPALKKDLSKNGNKDAIANSWDKAADKCLNIYNEILV